MLDQADFIASTTGIIKRAVESPAETLIIATEDGVFHQIEKQLAAVGKKKTAAAGARARRELRLQPLPLHAAQHAREALPVPARSRARGDRARADRASARCVPIQRMLELSKGLTLAPGR